MAFHNFSNALNLSSKLLKKEMEKFNNTELISFQKYLWDKVMELGLNFNKNFSRQDIIENLEKTTNYMYRMGCTYPKGYCRAKICITTNPNCARQKLSESILELKEMHSILITKENESSEIHSQDNNFYSIKKEKKDAHAILL